MRKMTRYSLLLAGAALLCVGIFLGQHQAVLAKAIRICLECVGIG